MATLRELKGRIKAVGNIKRITKTMQMIATAKFQASVRRATETKPYTEKVAELVGELAAASGQTGQIDHPLLHAPDPPVHRELLLVLTSNRGLCGAYNANVLRTANHHLRDRPETEQALQVVGKKGISYFRFQGFAVEKAHTHIGDEPAYEDVEALASEYIERFTAGEFDAVRVAYMKFVTNARQEPQIMTLLPLEPPEAEQSDEAATAGAIYEFSPDPQQLLAELLPITVKTQLFQAFNDAMVSEQVARMVAMKAATDNADQMGRDLRRQYNRARQAQITTELTEIVSGAEALS
jgi:F-type H+-transporting ATPase subunit gamma